MLRKSVFLLSALIIVPHGASAAFQAEVPLFAADWKVEQGITIYPQASALRIRAVKEGKVTVNLDLKKGVDELVASVSSQKDVELRLVWHRRKDPPSALKQVPIKISGSVDPSLVEVDLSNYKKWDRKADRIGISLPAGADITINSIKLTGRNPFEKLIEATKAFWKLDVYRPTTVNYLWGPLITTSSITRSTLASYDLHPRARSANRVFYVFLIVSGLVCMVCRKKVTVVVGITIALWVIYDLRMGIEMINYAKTDNKMYVSAGSEKVFRERGSFYSFAESVEPFIDEDKYVFLSEHNYPFWGLMRYITYPKRPIDIEDKGANTWVIYDHPYITVDQEGRLLRLGDVIVERGEIIHRVNDVSFVYRSI